MKRSTVFLRAVAILALAAAAVPLEIGWFFEPKPTTGTLPVVEWPAGPPGGWSTPSTIVVQMREPGSASALGAVAQREAVPLQWSGPMGSVTGIATAVLPPGVDASATLAALRSDARVEAADVLHTYAAPESMAGAAPAPPQPGPPPRSPARWQPNDPRYGEQWNFAMVNAEDAWTRARGRGVTVAVIDTGVAWSDSRKGKRARDFGSTRFVPGYDFVNGDTNAYDDNGHGTHVAGTIAESTDNGEGVAGLAFDCAIMPLKVLSGTGFGSSASIAEAIRWAADHGAQVINMSLGGPLPDAVMRAACQYAAGKGVVIVAAAGNSAREGVGYPGAFPECVAVSAVGPSKTLSFYSSWGRQVAIAAPGGDRMQDPQNGGILQNSIVRDGDGNLVDDYYAFQGTSMASPHVAAVAALLASEGMRGDDVRDVLLRSAQRVDGPADRYGAGIVDAGAATKLAASVHGDGVARFWLVAGLLALCGAFSGLITRRWPAWRAPWWPAAAFSAGLIFPDWFAGWAGMAAHTNALAHSIVIPGALFLLLAREDRTERRLLGACAAGLCVHMAWEMARGTAPFGPYLAAWSFEPWLAANIAVGSALAVAGLFTRAARA